MIPLLLATFFSSSFGLVVRYAQGKKCNLIAVGALNYLAAALFHAARALLNGNNSPAPATLIIGALGGVAYVSSYFMFLPVLKMRGVSISTALLRLSVLIPIAAAILFWGERPNAVQVVGAGLALMSLMLLGFNPQRNGQRLSRGATLLMIAVFIGNGLCSLSVRAFHQTGAQGQESLFLATLFGTAAVVSNIVWFARRAGTARKDVLPGIALGMCNALGNLSLVAALERFPSVLVFPLWSALGLAYAVVFARIVWREQVTRLELAGMGVTFFAIVFMNIA